MDFFKKWQLHSDKVLHGALYALIFFIPLSSSLKSVALVASILLLLGLKVHKDTWADVWQQSWVRAIAALLILVIVACAWSPAPWNEEWFVIEKYSKLLWLPLLMLGFTDPKTRQLGLHAFLGAMLLTACGAFVIALGWIHTELPSGSIFRNHIITGHMMSFASYLAGYFAIKQKRWRWLYLSLFVIYSYELLFISQGRTGYIIYFVLIALLMLQVFKQWQLLVGLVTVILFGVFTYHYSTIMQERVQWVKSDLLGIRQGDKNTSLGFRLQFQQFSYALFKQSPLIGNGTGSLTYYFDERNPIPAWGKQLREPHNQYWLIAAEYGLLGLMIYFGFLITLTVACLRLKEMKGIAFALLIPFVIGCFSDSLLFYSGCGYFFLTLMALCLGESCDTFRLKHHSDG